MLRVLLHVGGLLLQEPLETFTTARVAQKAGVSIGSLYQYFACREELAVACARVEFEACLARVERSDAAHVDSALMVTLRDVHATLMKVRPIHQLVAASSWVASIYETRAAFVAAASGQVARLLSLAEGDRDFVGASLRARLALEALAGFVLRPLPPDATSSRERQDDERTIATLSTFLLNEGLADRHAPFAPRTSLGLDA